jgi:hypothetical protein
MILALLQRRDSPFYITGGSQSLAYQPSVPFFVLFNPEPGAPAGFKHNRRPETAGASGFWLNKADS